MAKSRLVKANKKIAQSVVGGYKAIEEGIVGGFAKVTDKFVDSFLTQDDETVADAKKRLQAEELSRQAADKAAAEGHAAKHQR